MIFSERGGLAVNTGYKSAMSVQQATRRSPEVLLWDCESTSTIILLEPYSTSFPIACEIGSRSGVVRLESAEDFESPSLFAAPVANHEYQEAARRRRSPEFALRLKEGFGAGVKETWT